MLVSLRKDNEIIDKYSRIMSFLGFSRPQGLERLKAVTEGVPQSPPMAVRKRTTEVTLH